MAKSTEASPAGKALMAEITAKIREDLHSSETLHGIDAPQNLVFRWILACLYYVSHKNDKAESLWAKYNFIIGGKTVSKSPLIFWGLSKGMDVFAYKQLVEAMICQAKTFSKQASFEFAFLMALLALSCCVTTGLCNTPSGHQLMSHLHSFLRPYFGKNIDWKWIIKQVNLSRNDFIGLVSILLVDASFKTPCEMVSMSTCNWRKIA